MALLAVEHLTFAYPQQEHTVLRDCSFVLESGSFAVLCGATGCGKSTLLRLLKPELSPKGDCSGNILFQEESPFAWESGVSARRIGFVMQQPEQQIVTDTVDAELAFGMENLGLPPAQIRATIAETASYFGIAAWGNRETATLSGGQKQLLNLAAVMCMQPDLLILDEPTAQLDPIAAADFLATLERLNRDFGITILLAEHQLEQVLPLADQMLVMEQGTIAYQGKPQVVLSQLPNDAPMWQAMPTAARLAHCFGNSKCCPLTVREGRAMLAAYGTPTHLPQKPSAPKAAEPILAWKAAYLRYESQDADVLCHLDLQVYAEEWYCLIGGNGAGKSSVLLTAAGLYPCYAGTLTVCGERITTRKRKRMQAQTVTLLPQDVQTLFLCNTVAEELADADAGADLLGFDWTPYLTMHPYDLSGGEQQLLALTKVLAVQPTILLLDEPTKGLDAPAKARLAAVLHRLQQDGMTLLTVTHDMEFAANHADRCGLLYRGALAAEGTPAQMFSTQGFYTTAAARIAAGRIPHAVTVSAIAAAYGKDGMP